MVDSILGTFKKVRKETDPAVVQNVRYICNLGFDGKLDPCKNSKFPGQMVVSLTKKDLMCLSGEIPVTFPYKDSELLSWLKPKKNAIPYVLDMLMGDSTKVYNKKLKKNVGQNMLTLDFGSEKYPFGWNFSIDLNTLNITFDLCPSNNL